jgi:hypothetical protein
MQYTYHKRKDAIKSQRHWNKSAKSTSIRINKRKIGKTYTLRINLKKRK